MDLNKKLKELKPQQLNCNVFDVYSYNGLTMQDLLCQFFTTINECVKSTNEVIDLTDWLVSVGLEEEVVKKLMALIEDGTVEKLINVNLFKTLNNEINGLSSQVEQNVIELYKKANSSEVVGKTDQISLNQIPTKSITQNQISDELLQQIAGNTPINAVPSDGSITYDKLSSEVKNTLEKNNCKVLADLLKIEKEDFNYILSTSSPIRVVNDKGQAWGFEQLNNYTLENNMALVANINREVGNGYSLQTLSLSDVGLDSKNIVIAYCYYGRYYGIGMNEDTISTTKLLVDKINMCVSGSITDFSKTDFKFNISTGRIIITNGSDSWKFNGLDNYTLNEYRLLIADISKEPNNTEYYDLTEIDFRGSTLNSNQIAIIGNYYGDLTTKLSFEQERKYPNLAIYRPSQEETYVYRKYNDKYIRYNFKKINNDSINYNSIRLYNISICDTSFTHLYTISDNSEWECAIYEVGKDDFIGGFHGDESAKNIIYLVNGKKDDIIYNKITEINSFSLLVDSELYRCDTNEIVAERKKEIKITEDGLIINNKINWKKSLNVTRSELGMLTANRSNNGYEISKYAFCDYDYNVEEVNATSEITNPKNNIRKATMYSENISLTLESRCNPLLPNNNFQCMYNENTGTNKFYFNFSGNYTTEIDEVWIHESIYTIQPK